MRIQNTCIIHFKRRLKPTEESEYSSVLNRGKFLAGNTGKSVLIVPSPSLPQDKTCNTGVGNILDKTALEFFDFAKKYWGINCIQDLPNGNFAHYGKQWSPYSGSSFDLGVQIINLHMIPTELLNNKYLNRLIYNNVTFDKIIFENIITPDSDAENILKEAYTNLIKADTDTKRNILSEMKVFETKNKLWLEPKAIFKVLEKEYNTSNIDCWGFIDKNLYNPDIITPEQRQARILEINKVNTFEAGYYKFKQYLADKHLKLAKEELNKRGLMLCGDVLSCHTGDEVWMRPKAFIPNTKMYWDFPALNLDSKEGQDFLREKIKLYAKRYDNIRIDAAWTYVNQPLKLNGSRKVNLHKYYNDKILKIIEEEVRQVKGKNYRPENIMYEFIARLEDFRACDSDMKLLPMLEKRNKIYCSNDLSPYWGTTEAFKNMGWDKNFYVLGATNHDQMPLKFQFSAINSRKQQAETLSKILKIPLEKLDNLNDFIKAKFAEPMRAKNNMIFFSDALNLEGRYKDNPNSQNDYRLKIPDDYQNKYFKSLTRGEGYNPMDALEKSFRANGLDKKEPELYKKIVKYRKILEKPDNSRMKSKLTKVFLGILTVCFAAREVIRYHSGRKEKPDIVQPE